MIIDTSVLMAILLREPEGERFASLILRADENKISAGTLLEAQIVAIAHRGSKELAALLEQIGADIIPFDARQAALAAEGFERFGKGRHPAGLNFGDCFAYAAAKAFDEPLLFKGTDFSKTDVNPAVALK